MAQSSSVGGTSSRRHLRDHDASSPGSNRYADADWESREAMLHKELEEVKARAAQMEKTMRWWSDCTANWREKWCEVRDERNKIKKETKGLKNRLEAAMKDLNSYKMESQELKIQNAQLKKEMEKIHTVLLQHDGQFDELLTTLELESKSKNSTCVDQLIDMCNDKDPTENLIPVLIRKERDNCKSPPKDTLDSKSSDKDLEEYISQGAVPKHALDSHKDTSPIIQEKRHSRIDTSSEEALTQKMSLLNSRLEEATKPTTCKKDEKALLYQQMEKLTTEIVQMREKCEELQDGKTAAIKELMELKERFQREISASQTDLTDETNTQENMDQRLSELRAELEKLQAENAAEWGKRERLESEKISLERENKRLRNELREAQERTESRKSRPVSTCDTLDSSKQLQQELLERNKELADLKLSHAKLKKMLAEKTTELSHASRRSEQYEAEVKRIRARVEELKKELALAQDEVDAANNSIRRLQRANEDLTEQLESTNAQLEHHRNSMSESRAPDVVAEIMDDKTRNDDEEDGKNC